MKTYVILNQTTVEKEVARLQAQEDVTGTTKVPTPIIVAGSEAQMFPFTEANGAPRVFGTDKAEAEKHLDFLCVKYPHLEWALLETITIQKADIPMSTRKSK